MAATELYIDGSESCLAAEMVARYSGAIKEDKCVLRQVSENSVAALNLPQLPFLVTADAGAVSGLIPVSKYITSKVAEERSMQLTGDEPHFKAMVNQWMSFVLQKQMKLSDANSLNALNSQLETLTFIAGHSITLADLVLFPMVFTWIDRATPKERALNCSITRWFDHMQHLPGIIGVMPQLPVLTVLPECTLDAKPPQGKKANKAKAPKKGNPSADTSNTPNQPQKGAKKQPKQQKQPAAPEREVDDPSRLEIRVGLITKIWEHPDADSLYCEEIDIGEAQPRKIASGLRKFIAVDGLLGQKCLVLANLKARSLRGFSSHGMVLCGSDSSRSVIELVRPPKDAKIGELVTLEGISFEGSAPDEILPTKEGKDPFKAVSTGWSTSEDMEALYKGMRWMTSAGHCFCDTIVDGTIS